MHRCRWLCISITRRWPSSYRAFIWSTNTSAVILKRWPCSRLDRPCVTIYGAWTSRSIILWWCSSITGRVWRMSNAFF